MKALFLALAVTAAFYMGALLIGPYAHAASIELALHRIVYLGQYQQVLGQSFTAAPLAIVIALALSLAKVQHAARYALAGAGVAAAVGFAIGPSWPSHQLIYAVGELAFILTAGATAWASTLALTSRSRPTPSARP